MTFTPRCRWFVLLLTAGLLGQSPAPPLQPSQSLQPSQTAATRPAVDTSSGSLPTGTNVAVIKIEGLIYGYTLTSLESRVDQALSSGASLVVIELDTNGGTVDSALKISKYIKNMNASTVAWINPSAYSAGIMIAAACDRIIMAPASATGDCAPIVPGMNLSPTERAKALSPILEEFRDSARDKPYDYVLFHAMCVLGIEVYEIEHIETKKRRFVNQADYRVMVDGVSVTDQQPPSSPAKPSPPTTQSSTASAGSVVDVASATVTVATEADRGKWRLVKKVHDGTTLLTLNQQRALEVSLSEGTVRDEAELKQFLGATTVTMFPPSRVVLVAYWLTQPWVRALLVLAMMLGAYTEFQAPGIGVAGLVALTAVVVVVRIQCRTTQRPRHPAFRQCFRAPGAGRCRGQRCPRRGGLARPWHGGARPRTDPIRAS